MHLFGPESLGTVTRVEEAKGLTSVYVGRKRIARIASSKAAALGIIIGMEWTLSLAEHAALITETTRAIKKAIGLLRIRGRSEHELRQRLTQAGFDPAPVDAAIAELLTKGLLNDRTLAVAVAAKGAEKGTSQAAMLQQIRHRGIDAEAAQHAISHTDESPPAGGELQRAIQAARNRLAKIPESKTAAARHRALLSALARLGYDEETATDAVTAVLGAIPGEDPADPD